jgi:hypothetical protein
MPFGAYVSPVGRAHDLLALKRHNGRAIPGRAALASARRITRLGPVLVTDLETELATYRIFRWVAWGKTATARHQRAALVLHLRHTIDTPRGGWPTDLQLTAALGVWQGAVADARAHGLAQPAPRDLPVAAYLSAFATVVRSKRRSPKGSARRASPRIVLTDEERALIEALPRLAKLLKRVG